MTPAELREAVARAIRGDLEDESPWRTLEQSARDIWLEHADAALRVVREAMREPPATIKTATGFGLATTWAQEVYLQMLAASPLREE